MIISLRAAIIPFTVAVLAVVTVLLYKGGLSEESTRAYIRLTAGTSMILFALAWSASSLDRLLPAGRWQPVMSARRRIGIAFAVSHTFHLLGIWLLMQVVLGGNWSEADPVTGGGIYVVIYLMALTSNDYSIRALGGKTWKRLHWAGGYIIWASFTVSYAGKLLEPGSLQHYVFTLLCLALLLIRIFARGARRKLHAAAASP
jgi:DMSO/TMAO reductase YedYZ heme-binding membrane subunit